MLDRTASTAMLDMHRALPSHFQEAEIETLINMVDNTSLTVVLELLACFAYEQAKRGLPYWNTRAKILDRAAEEVSDA